MVDSETYKKLIEMEREVSEELYKKAAVIDPMAIRRVMEEAADQAFEAYRVKQTLDKANKKQTSLIEEEYPSEVTYSPVIDPTPIRERLNFLRNQFRQAMSPLTEPMDADSFIREKIR